VTNIVVNRPKLSLGKKAPLVLELYRSKIGLPPIPVKAPDQPPEAGPSNRNPSDARGVSRPSPKRIMVCVSQLTWPAKCALEPPVEIPGTPVPAEQTRVYKSAKSAEMAARLWTRKIAWQVAQGVPEAEREAAERFVLRHRASVLNAFHRRLRRGDVVQFLAQSFQTREMSRLDVSHTAFEAK
jgi:hypothetical protein